MAPILGGCKQMKLPSLPASRGVSRKLARHVLGIQEGHHFELGTAYWVFVKFPKAQEEQV